MSNPSANAVDSAFRIYSKSDHFLPPLLLPPLWFKPPSLTSGLYLSSLCFNCYPFTCSNPFKTQIITAEDCHIIAKAQVFTMFYKAWSAWPSSQQYDFPSDDFSSSFTPLERLWPHRCTLVMPSMLPLQGLLQLQCLMPEISWFISSVPSGPSQQSSYCRPPVFYIISCPALSKTLHSFSPALLYSIALTVIYCFVLSRH